jgi:hypothetical protein
MLFDVYPDQAGGIGKAFSSLMENAYSLDHSP